MCTVYEFSPYVELELGEVVCLNGRRGSGVSTACKDLCHALTPRIDMLVVIDPFAEKGDYPKCATIFEDWDEDFMDRLLRSQQEAWRQHNAHELGQKRKHPPKRGLNICVVMNAQLIDHMTWKSKVLRKMLSSSMRYHITILITTQSPSTLNPYCRSQIDWALTAGTNVAQEQDKLYDTFFSMFAKFSHFKKAMMDICTQNTMLGVRNHFSADKNDKFFWWYQFPSTPPNKQPSPASSQVDFQVIKRSRQEEEEDKS